MTRQIARYGWRPSPPDHRDYLYHLDERVYRGSQLPAKADLWPNVPPIWNQGNLGSCTAHGSLRAFLTEATKQGVATPMLSRLMEYFNTRATENTTAFDAGGTVRDAVGVLASQGCAPETDWPYDVTKFAVPPPEQAVANAKQYMSVKYQSVLVGGPGAPMRTALASGLAIVFGFSVPTFFEGDAWDPATEVLPLPQPSDGFIGGHCVTLTGYDFSRTLHPEPYFIADNSWGAGWGGTWGGIGCTGGRFALASNWFNPWRGLATDLWVIQGVT